MTLPKHIAEYLADNLKKNHKEKWNLKIDQSLFPEKSFSKYKCIGHNSEKELLKSMPIKNMEDLFTISHWLDIMNDNRQDAIEIHEKIDNIYDNENLDEYEKEEIQELEAELDEINEDNARYESLLDMFKKGKTLKEICG